MEKQSSVSNAAAHPAAPGISVIIPTYNRPDAIARCVAALQAQRDVELEIIVVDDGSAQVLPALPLEPHTLRLIRQTNAGPAAARNTGAGAAIGDILLFTDDDCVPESNWAASMASAMQETRQPTLLGGHTINGFADNLYAETSQDMNTWLSSQAAGFEPFFASNNIGVPRSEFLALGGFDTGYRRAAGEDRAFCRNWRIAGHAFKEVDEAKLIHFHQLSLGKFWRQHRNYGFGASRFHSEGTSGAANLPQRFTPHKQLGFYTRLITSPLRHGLSKRTLLQSFYILIAQVATVRGFVEARQAQKEQADA